MLTEESLGSVKNQPLCDLDSQLACEGKYTYLVIISLHIRHIHIVCRRTNILVLLPSEDIQSHKMHFSVTMLPRLRCRHFNYLAWTALNHDMAVFAKWGTLGRISVRSPRPSLFKILLSHFLPKQQIHVTWVAHQDFQEIHAWWFVQSQPLQLLQRASLAPTLAPIKHSTSHQTGHVECQCTELIFSVGTKHSHLLSW